MFALINKITSEINFVLESKIKTKNEGLNLKLQFSKVVFTTADIGIFATTERMFEQKLFDFLSAYVIKHW